VTATSRTAGRAVRLAPLLLVLPVLALDPAPATAASYDAGAPRPSTPASTTSTLTTTTTAVGRVDRSYTWSLEKAVDATTRSVDASGRARFRYTVTARAGAMTESGWTLTGEATIASSGASPTTSDVSVATDLGGAATCTVTGGDDVRLGAGETVTLPWTCTFGSAPAPSGTVTATAAWDPAGDGAVATSTGSAPASFAVRESGATVAVVDDQGVPGQSVVLEPELGWAPGLERSWAYDLAVAGGAPGACASHTSTTSIDLVSGAASASTTVRACTPEVLPAQAFGSPVGSVRARCRGRVRATMANRSGEAAVYVLRIGAQVHRIAVGPLATRSFVTRGRASQKVTLKVDGRRLDRIRVPQRCAASVSLDDLGLG
jgi:hypothetical protein